MNKNQALVWITIIIAVLIYSLNSVVHSKYRYLEEIDLLQQKINTKDLEIEKLTKAGSLLAFESLESSNELKFKKNGNISQKVIALQNDNISIIRILDRYSNLHMRNVRAIKKFKSVLKTISTEVEEKRFKEEQAKIKANAKKVKPVAKPVVKKVQEVTPLLESDSKLEEHVKSAFSESKVSKG